MSLAKKLERNIPLYLWGEFFGELLFIVPIWIAFEKGFLSFAQITLLASSRFALTLLLELPTGAFADLFGRRISMGFGQIINALGLLLMAFGGSAITLIIGTLIRAVGDSFISGSSTAIVYDTMKELGREKEFSKVRGRANLMVQYAVMCGSVVGGYLFTIWSGLAHATYAMSCLISAFLYFLMTEPHIDTQKFTFKRYIEQNKLGFKELFKNDYTKNLSIFYALIGGITWAWIVFFNQIYAEDIGYGEIQRGWLFASVRFVNAFIILRLLHLERFLTKKNVFILHPLLIIFSSLPALIAPTFVGTIFIFTLTLSSSLRFVILDGYTNDQFDSRYRASAVSALNLFVGIIYVFLVGASGPILERFDSRLILSLMGILTLVFILPRGIALSKNHK